MKQWTLVGHPVHPMVVAAPAALWPLAAAMDVMYVATGERRYADMAYVSLAGGVAGGLAAAVTGAADYLTIRPGGPLKQAANTHALLNIGTMALATTNLLLRRRGEVGPVPILLSLLGAAGVAVSQWYGGELVYRYGMRVDAAAGRKQPKAKLPGDEAVARGLERIQQLMPVGGPGKEE